jgi:hypothetical protein
MTDKERVQMARQGAKEIVTRLRESNEQNENGKGPAREEYAKLEKLITRKFLRK